MRAADLERRAKISALFLAHVPVREIAARFGVQNPAIFKALRAAGTLPPYRPSKPGGKGRPIGGGASGYSARRRETALASSQFDVAGTWVHRDPCPRCGTRADFGCEHSRSPISMGAFA